MTSLARAPITGLSSLVSWPNLLKTSIKAELRPRCATRQASSAASSWTASRASNPVRSISFNCSSMFASDKQKSRPHWDGTGIPAVPPNLAALQLTLENRDSGPLIADYHRLPLLTLGLRFRLLVAQNIILRFLPLNSSRGNFGRFPPDAGLSLCPQFPVGFH